MVQSLLRFETMDTPVTPAEISLEFVQASASYNGSPPTCGDQRRTSRKSKTGPLLTRTVDQLALGTRSEQHHPSLSKYVPLTGK